MVTTEVAVFRRVSDAVATLLTTVPALPQLASEQLPLDGGSEGVPPVGPTVA